jgi:lysine 2,3-aminomutase
MTYDLTKFTADSLKEKCSGVFDIGRSAMSIEDLRIGLTQLSHNAEFEAQQEFELHTERSIIRVRDCARSLFRIVTRRSDHLAKFSVVQAIWDVSRDVPRSSAPGNWIFCRGRCRSG